MRLPPAANLVIAELARREELRKVFMPMLHPGAVMILLCLDESLEKLNRR